MALKKGHDAKASRAAGICQSPLNVGEANDADLYRFGHLCEGQVAFGTALYEKRAEVVVLIVWTHNNARIANNPNVVKNNFNLFTMAYG